MWSVPALSDGYSRRPAGWGTRSQSADLFALALDYHRVLGRAFCAVGWSRAVDMASAAADLPPVRRGGNRYGYRVRLTTAAIMVTIVLAAGCSEDDDTGTAPTTSEQMTTLQRPSSDLADCPRRPAGSSPATFDSSGGTYAAQSLTALEGRKLQFDVVQWLSGDDANEAYFRESDDDSGAPNDYYILNERDELRMRP